VTGFFASRTGYGPSSRDCLNLLGMLAQRAIFHLLDEPVPVLADPFPEDGPLAGAYRLHLPSDDLTIWYTITKTQDGQVVIVVHYIKANT
jgi:hypothetical protein